MTKGLYRDKEGWAVVYYGRHRMPITRAQYINKGYCPPYDKLPSKAKYQAAVQFSARGDANARSS